jgi:polysaccharide biosynthesis protein PslE
MREQLYALELKEQDISTKFQEGTFIVDQIRAQVEAAKKTLKAETDPLQVTKSLNAAYQAMQNALLDVQSKVSGYKAQVAALDTQLAAAKRSLELFNEHETQMVHLERQIELEKGSFKKYAENRELARIDQALEKQNITNLNLLQAPSRSATPTSPRVILNLAFGFVLAVFAAFAAAIFAEWRGVPAAVAEPTNDDRWYASREEEPAVELPENSEDSSETLAQERNHELPAQPR